MIPLNQNLTAMKRSGIRAFTELARQTPDCRMLTIGEPDFDTPAPIRAAAAAALDRGETHYAPNQGVAALRQAIAQFETRRGNPTEAAQVLVTAAATQALFTALMGILNPGEEVVVPTPAFPLYESIITAVGGKMRVLDLTRTGFQITPDALAEVITPRTRAIVLNSPNNPTGCVYTHETLEGIHHVLRDKPIFVICDDVYRALCYTDDYHSFAEYADMRDRSIVVQSFSKPYAMTGWRLGYCMADAPVMSRIQVLHQYGVTSIPSFVQRACVTALGLPTDGVAEIFRKRRDYVYRRLRGMGLTVEEPQGAFYMFIDIRAFGMDSVTFCTRMLKENLVGLIPGIYFGTEGFMRLSYCYSDEDLKKGLDRVERFIKSL